MSDKFTIEVIIWDSWEIDTYTQKGYTVYTLIQINDTLKLIERNLNESSTL